MRPLRWLGWTLLALLLLVVAAIAALFAAARSEGGSAWLLGRVPGLTVTGPRGALLGQPFQAASLRYQQPGVDVTVDGLAWQALDWRFRPWPGAWLGLLLDQPTARRIDVRTTPQPAPKDKPATQAPNTLRFPFGAEVRGLRVGVLQIDQQPPVTDLQASAHLGADDGRQHRIDGLRLAAGPLQLQGSATVGTDAPMPIAAKLALSSRPEAPTPWLADLSLNGPLERPVLDAALRSGPRAAVDVRAMLAPFAPWPLAALNARTQDLDLADLAAGLPSTKLSGEAEVQSSGLDAPVQIDAALRNALPGRWDQARLPVQDLQFTVRGQPSDRRTIDLQRFALAFADGQRAAGTLTGSGQWQGDALALDLDFNGLRPNQLDARAPAMTLAGPLSARLTGLPSPDGQTAMSDQPGAELRGQLQGRLDQGGTPQVDLRLALAGAKRPDGWQVRVDELNAQAGGARAEAKAHAEGRNDGSWTADSTGQLTRFDPGVWLQALKAGGPHRLNGQWQAKLAGPATAAAAPAPATSAASAASASTRPPAPPPLLVQLLAIRGQADVKITDSQLAGVPLQGRVELRNDNGRRVAAQADVQVAGNRVQLDGTTSAQAASDHWHATIAAPALAALAPLARLHPALASLPSDGRVDGEATVDGRWPALRSNGRLQASGVQAGTLRIGQLDTRWQGSNDADAPLSWQLDGRDIASGEQRIDTVRAALDGSLRAHRLQLDADSPLRPPAWAGESNGSQLRLRAEGGWRPADRVWQGKLAELRGQPRGGASNAWLSTSDVGLRIALDDTYALREASAEPGRITLLDAALSWTQARWQAPATGTTGGSGMGRLNVDAKLDPLKVSPWLAKLQPDLGWGGDLAIGGRFVVKTAESFDADVVLERSGGDLSLTDESGERRMGLSDLRIGLSAQNGVWHLTQAVAGTNLGVLAGAQSLRLPPQATAPTADTPLEGVLEWRIDDLGAWTPWLPPGWRLAGALHTSARLSGRVGAPEYTGQLTGSKLAVRNLLQGVNVQDGELAVSLRGTDAKVDRLHFKGGDGDLDVTGGASFGAQPRAQLRIEARRFQVLGRFDRRIVSSGSADMSLAGDAVKLDGRFGVDEGLIDFSRADAPALDTDVRVVNRTEDAPVHPDQAAKERQAAAEPPPGPLQKAQVNLQIDLGDKLALRGKGINTRLAGQLAVTTPGGRLAVNGTVRTEAGRYAAYGQDLTIDRGYVVFTGPVDNPRLDIRALRSDLDIAVGVTITGTASNPRVRLYSDPDMSELDKLSYLVNGKAPEGLGRGDAALLQRAALALLAGENSGQGGGLLKNIGLDDLSVRQDETGNVKDTVVSLGKQLSQRWYIGYERGVNTATGSWQLIYRIARQFTVRGQAGGDNAVDAIWTWRWD